MNHIRLLGAMLALALAGCGANDAPAGGGFAPARLASLPATLEGDFETTNTEGDEEDGGALSFGVLKVGSDEYLVEIDTALLSAAGFPDDGEHGRVRATLGRNSEFGEDSYVITEISKL
jgi:hypothetical protein